jgi:hypothetical protein
MVARVARELFLTPLFSVAFSARPRLAILEESVAKVQRPAGAPGLAAVFEIVVYYHQRLQSQLGGITSYQDIPIVRLYRVGSVVAAEAAKTILMW